MPSDSTKTLVDLREEVSFHVGGVKNPLFLFPAKKARNERWEVVFCALAIHNMTLQKTKIKRAQNSL
jgi:hypothetical protein